VAVMWRQVLVVGILQAQKTAFRMTRSKRKAPASEGGRYEGEETTTKNRPPCLRNFVGVSNI
jgi:hypothetical protein